MIELIKELEYSVTNLLGVGLARADLSALNMGLRALLIYIIGIILVRVTTERLAGKPTTFDIMIALILGSVISRAINGDAPIMTTLVAAFVLVAVHYIFSVITFYSSKAGIILKGKPTILIEDGKIIWYNLRKSLISENDLLSSLRLKGKSSPKEVKLAVLERNGEISVISYNNCKCTPDKRAITVYIPSNLLRK